jgi:hypothetical protein
MVTIQTASQNCKKIQNYRKDEKIESILKIVGEAKWFEGMLIE